MPNLGKATEQTTALAVIDTAIRGDRRRLKALLPAHVPVDRALQTVLAAARRTPGLLDCTPESFVYALRESARWGLLPDGIMGQGYLIPRRNGDTGLMEAHFQAGYRGLEDLARRSGNVGSIISGWHCERDVFRIRLGLHGDVEHEPAMTDRGAIVGFYAAAWLTNGSPPVVIYMEDAEVIAIRNAVPYWSKGPWASHYGMMGRKTAVRRLVTQLPLSPDMQAIVALDEAPWERASNVTPATDDPAPSTAKARRMRAMLERRNGDPEAQATSDVGSEADGSQAVDPDAAGDGEAPRAQGIADGQEAPERITGTVRLPDRPGLNGMLTESPAGQIIGFRLDVGDEWMQVILSGAVLDRHEADQTPDHLLEVGTPVTVVGRRVIVSRSTPEGLAMPPVIRIIATEDIEWDGT